MEIYKKYYNLKTTIVLFFFIILSVLLLTVLPILEPLDDRVDIVLYALLLIIFLPCIVFLLNRIFTKTLTLITISEKGIERKTILKTTCSDWSQVTLIEKVFVPDYFTGYGQGYRFKASGVFFDVYKSRELDLLLNSNLEIWSKDLYRQFIEVKDNELNQYK